MTEYRIDELARAAGTTVRNIRAYQDRDLLPPPRLVGRVGVYDETHLARLRLIGKLLSRRYTFAIIRELLSAWERGHELQEILGLEKVLTDPWSDEIPAHVTREELAETFATGQDPGEFPGLLRRAVDLGLIEPEGGRYRVPSPRLLNAGAELVAVGVPLAAVLDIAEQISGDCDVIAARFVGLVHTHVFSRLSAGAAHGGDDVAAIARRMRPLVKMVIEPFIARSMENRIHQALGDRLAEILSRRDVHDVR